MSVYCYLLALEKELLVGGHELRLNLWTWESFSPRCARSWLAPFGTVPHPVVSVPFCTPLPALSPVSAPGVWRNVWSWMPRCGKRHADVPWLKMMDFRSLAPFRQRGSSVLWYRDSLAPHSVTDCAYMLVFLQLSLNIVKLIRGMEERTGRAVLAWKVKIAD